MVKFFHQVCLYAHADIHGVIVLHLGLEGCSQPMELWFSDIIMYISFGKVAH